MFYNKILKYIQIIYLIIWIILSFLNQLWNNEKNFIKFSNKNYA